MSKAAELKKIIQILAGTYDKDFLSFELATIDTIDTNEWTCTATPVSGLAQTEITDIQLSAELSSNGLILVPKIGSNVILAITLRNEVYVMMCSEVDQLIFYRDNGDNTFQSFIINGDGIAMGDGSYGGLVIGDTSTGLQAQINNLNAQVQALIKLLTTWIVTPNDGGAALKAAAISALPGLPNADFSQILSSHIKHGKPLTNE